MPTKPLGSPDLCHTKANDGDKLKEFHNEQESTPTVKFIYTVVMSDFSANLGSEGKAGEKYIFK